jgi:hypothetical protein
MRTLFVYCIADDIRAVVGVAARMGDGPAFARLAELFNAFDALGVAR